MAVDVYSVYARLYNEKYTRLKHRETLNIPFISLEGATNIYITPKYEYAPDLISYDVYGVEDFDDLIAIANKFTDPIKDFYVGRLIVLPTFQECVRVLGI